MQCRRKVANWPGLPIVGPRATSAAFLVPFEDAADDREGPFQLHGLVEIRPPIGPLDAAQAAAAVAVKPDEMTIMRTSQFGEGPLAGRDEMFDAGPVDDDAPDQAVADPELAGAFDRAAPVGFDRLFVEPFGAAAESGGDGEFFS